MEMVMKRTFLCCVTEAIQCHRIRQIEPGISQRLANSAIHQVVNVGVIRDGRFWFNGNNGV